MNAIGIIRLLLILSSFFLYSSVACAGSTEIVVRKSNKCLDVVAESIEDGAEIQQYRCWNGKNQLWALKPMSDNYYYIISEKSNKCLDITDESKKDGARVRQYKCRYGDSQLWKINNKGGNYFELVNKSSGKCLDVIAESVDDGARLQQYRCWGGENQLFHIANIASATSSYAPRIVVTPTIRAADKRVNLGGGGASASAWLLNNNLTIMGRAWSDSASKGTKASVQVVISDKSGSQIYASTLYNIPTACSKLDTCPSRTYRTWGVSVPAGVEYPNASSLTIYLNGR